MSNNKTKSNKRAVIQIKSNRIKPIAGATTQWISLQIHQSNWIKHTQYTLSPNQSISQSIDQSINQSVNLSTNHLINESFKKQSIKRPISRIRIISDQSRQIIRIILLYKYNHVNSLRLTLQLTPNPNLFQC